MKEEQRFFTITAKPNFVKKLDSGEYGTIWHRVRVDHAGNKKAGLRLCFFASDAEDDFQDELSFHSPFEDVQDILLHRYKGRYLWVKASLSSRENKTALLRRIRVYYPAHSFVRYLPEVYQEKEESEFLVRFLGIFQSLYLDMEEAITEIAAQLDPAASGKLAMLVSWLRLEEFEELSAERQRLFLQQCARYYKSWGTKDTLCAVVAWLTGEKPLVVEHFQLKDFMTEENKDLLERHYGKNPFDFTVILGVSGLKYDRKETAFVEKVIGSMKPAGSNFRLIVLSERLVLDSYTYLGINSLLTGHPRPILDANETLTTFMLTH